MVCSSDMFSSFVSLEEGLGDGYRLLDLRRKLDVLPPEPADNLRRTTQTFDRRYLAQVAALFQMIKVGPKPLSRLGLSLADEEDTRLVIKTRRELTLAFPFQRFCRAIKMERRLESVCESLLEAPIWFAGNPSSEFIDICPREGYVA